MTFRIAIIGGVAGGAGAAAAARRANESASIDLFEAGPYISFANCGLPYYLSGEIKDRGKLLVTKPETFTQRFNVHVHMNHPVLAIDRARKNLRVKSAETGAEFEQPYDRLVIATGAIAMRPATPGLDHPRVSECRTIADVDRLAALITAHPKGRALVIGGGFIGIEVAEALTMRGMTVQLVNSSGHILPPLDPEIAHAGEAEMAKHGVFLTLGTQVTRIDHHQNESIATLSNGKSVTFDLAVLAIGVLPDTSLGKAAGLAVGATGGLAVDEHQRTSDPSIYAAGDVTELLFWPTQTRMKIALAGPANKQGRVAGANAASTTPFAKTSGAAGTNIIRVFDLTIGMTGLSEKAAAKMNIPHRICYTENGHHAGYFPGAQPLFIKLIFSPTDGRVLGGKVFGREGVDKRIDVLATAIQGRFTVDQLADLDLSYAPPFGAAKDPVIIAGMVASNIFHGRSVTITPRELAAALASDAPPVVVDVRSPTEHAAGGIAGSINLPIETLRDSHSQLPASRPLVVHCAVGYRGYLAERLLRQLGYDVRNLTGGFRAWQLIRSQTK